MTCATAHAALQPPARVQAVAREFDLALSRQTVRSGPVVVELVNFGEDPHDLVIRRISPASRAFRIPEQAPGDHRELTARLGPGRYRLWCAIGDHRERGMRAVLVVRK